MSDRPAPYPPETRSKGWRFELDLEQIDQSDTWALTPAEIRPWLLMLWAVSWRQTPCGSLPDNDELIAVRLGMDIDLFAKHRAKLMRGWWKADDGRLYHDTLIKRVAEKLERQRFFQRQREYQALLPIIFERDGGACVYCGSREFPTLDHIVPRSRGGGDGFDNLALACRSCNSSKGARTPEEWIR